MLKIKGFLCEKEISELWHFTRRMLSQLLFVITMTVLMHDAAAKLDVSFLDAYHGVIWLTLYM